MEPSGRRSFAPKNRPERLGDGNRPADGLWRRGAGFGLKDFVISGLGHTEWWSNGIFAKLSAMRKLNKSQMDRVCELKSWAAHRFHVFAVVALAATAVCAATADARPVSLFSLLF